MSPSAPSFILQTIPLRPSVTSCPHPAEGEGLAGQLAGVGRQGDVPSCPQPPLAPWAQGQGTNCSAVMPGWPPQVQCDAFRFCWLLRGPGPACVDKAPSWAASAALPWHVQGARRARTCLLRAPCLSTHCVLRGLFLSDATCVPFTEDCLY